MAARLAVALVDAEGALARGAAAVLVGGARVAGSLAGHAAGGRGCPVVATTEPRMCCPSKPDSRGSRRRWYNRRSLQARAPTIRTPRGPPARSPAPLPPHESISLMSTSGRHVSAGYPHQQSSRDWRAAVERGSAPDTVSFSVRVGARRALTCHATGSHMSPVGKMRTRRADGPPEATTCEASEPVDWTHCSRKQKDPTADLLGGRVSLVQRECARASHGGQRRDSRLASPRSTARPSRAAGGDSSNIALTPTAFSPLSPDDESVYVARRRRARRDVQATVDGEAAIIVGVASARGSLVDQGSPRCRAPASSRCCSATPR